MPTLTRVVHFLIVLGEYVIYPLSFITQGSCGPENVR